MRNVPALGRIGDPDDIIASVRVENGEASVAATRRDVVTDQLLCQLADPRGNVSAHAVVPTVHVGRRSPAH